MKRLLAAVGLLCFASALADARPVRIVAFGDSATAGYLIKPSEAYPAQLEAALRKRGHDVAVKNAGVNGDTTVGALKRFDLAIDPDTDIALVEFGTNDLRMRLSPKRMRANLSEIVRTLRARGIGVLLLGLGSLDLSGVARETSVAYMQMKLPRGQHRARDGAHFNARGYAILVKRMLSQVEALMEGARQSPR